MSNIDTNTNKLNQNIIDQNNLTMTNIDTNTNKLNQNIIDQNKLMITNIDSNTNKLNQNIIDQNILTMANIDTNTNKLNQNIQLETDKILNNIDTNTNNINKTIETEMSFLSTEVSNGFSGLYKNTDKLINQNDIIIEHTSNLNDIATNTSTIVDKIIPITENIETMTGYTEKILFSTNEIKQNSSVISLLSHPSPPATAGRKTPRSPATSSVPPPEPPP
jgi:hypothetical protein